MGSEFDGGPADGQNLTKPYLTEGPSRAQNLTYYPPLAREGWRNCSSAGLLRKGDDPIAIVYKGPTFVNSQVMAL